jgi:hypothetical protein
MLIAVQAFRRLRQYTVIRISRRVWCSNFKFLINTHRRSLGGWFLSRRDNTIVARHEVPLEFGHWRGGNRNDLCPKGGDRLSPGLNGAKIREVWDGSRPGKAVGNPTQAGSPCYINFPECETMSQKHLPGGPRTNGNHADRLV